MSLTEIIDKFRTWLNTDTGIVVQFISLVFSAFGLSVFSISIFLKKSVVKHSLLLKQIGVVSLILGLGVVFPIVNLTLSPWHGWVNIILHILAIWGLSSFLGLIYIIRSMNKIIKDNEPTKPES